MTSDRRAGRRDLVRVAVGLGVPVMLVVPTIPVLARVAWAPGGVPASLWWLFACIPLTSLCLAAVWFAFDRDAPDDAEPR